MSNPAILLPVPQQDNSGFWRHLEGRFLDGANEQVTHLVFDPVAQKSHPPSLNTPLSRDNKFRACLESSGSEENDSDASVMETLADEEKMHLLNKTTELQRLNKELMKLSQEWDYIYHTTTLKMQQKMSSLQMEVVGLKQHTEGLSIRLEHEKNKKERYEKTLLQELKKNQQLQEYVRYLESKLCQDNERRTLVNFLDGYGISPILMTKKSLKDGVPYRYRHNMEGQKIMCCKHQLGISNSENEIDLMEQLESLKCQTEVFEGGALTEHKERQRMKAENEQIHKKEEEIRKQMAHLQEQIKAFEDGFKKDHSTKKVFHGFLNKSHCISPIPGTSECNSREKLSASSIASFGKPKAGSSSSSSSSSKQCEQFTLKCSEGAKYPKKKEAKTQVPPSQ